MKLSIYSATGALKQSMDLPSSLFGAEVNKGLMHLALVRQQSNRRTPVAHVRHRGEVAGSTRKLYQQKGTGRARRGAIRSPLMRGGGKSFGPRSNANFVKDMPQKMRRAALISCLSFRAKEEGCILGLENYPDDVKTKALMTLLKKMPLQIGRRIVIVLPGRHRGLELSARNIPRVKTLFANYLNPEDVLGAKHIIFLVDALKVAEDTFGKKEAKVKTGRTEKTGKTGRNEAEDASKVAKKAEKPSASEKKKPAAKKKSSPSRSS